MIEKKDIILSAVCICLGAGIGFGTKSMLMEEKEQEPAASEVQKQEVSEKDDSEEKTKPVDAGQKEAPEHYTGPAVRYVKVMKNGSSTDIYYERLDKVKDILSDSLYETLSPEMSKEELEAEKEQADKIDEDSVTRTKVTDTQYSYRWKDEGSCEVSVIYTQRVTRGDYSDLERYLCRMEVTKKEGRYIITDIYEDSALSDGLY
ncbi:hypothetical protein MKC73_01295 [[Clostridium] innocuum]|nr:hypothetical protein [[Clostridium] innocuum]